MATLFGRKWTRKQLLERVGHPSQFATVRPCELTEGKSKGVAAIEFSTGSGFRFTVVPGRAMDISAAEYCGRSLCWRSPTGETAPEYTQFTRGVDWLYSFFGGMLTTCGLTYMGAPCVDEGQELGLHGQISNIPAQEVKLESGWDGDEYMIGVTGKVVEAAPFLPALSMQRSIFSFLGQDRLYVHDEITNIGHDPAPHMVLYHVNFGWPVVDEGSKIISPSLTVTPRDERAAEPDEEWNEVRAPRQGYAEKCYWHDVGHRNGATMAGVINPALGFGGYVSFNKNQLPMLVQWKMTNKGLYVVGLEPGTNTSLGRAAERQAGKLRMLKPGETVSYDLEIGPLRNQEECDNFESAVNKLLPRRRK